MDIGSTLLSNTADSSKEGTTHSGPYGDWTVNLGVISTTFLPTELTSRPMILFLLFPAFWGKKKKEHKKPSSEWSPLEIRNRVIRSLDFSFTSLSTIKFLMSIYYL